MFRRLYKPSTNEKTTSRSENMPPDIKRPPKTEEEGKTVNTTQIGHKATSLSPLSPSIQVITSIDNLLWSNDHSWIWKTHANRQRWCFFPNNHFGYPWQFSRRYLDYSFILIAFSTLSPLVGWQGTHANKDFVYRLAGKFKDSILGSGFEYISYLLPLLPLLKEMI